jgi:hypothetical protein
MKNIGGYANIVKHINNNNNLSKEKLKTNASDQICLFSIKISENVYKLFNSIMDL